MKLDRRQFFECSFLERRLYLIEQRQRLLEQRTKLQEQWQQLEKERQRILAYQEVLDERLRRMCVYPNAYYASSED